MNIDYIRHSNQNNDNVSDIDLLCRSGYCLGRPCYTTTRAIAHPPPRATILDKDYKQTSG